MTEGTEGRFRHEPVLVEETLTTWVTDPRGCYLDGTIGLGGHAGALLSRFPGARLLGLDRDPVAVEASSRRLAGFGERVRLGQGDFADLERFVGDQPVIGILLDLGVSSYQLDDPRRGFSWQESGPLLMTLNGESSPSAAELLAKSKEGDLKRIFRDLGELPGAGRAARAVVAARDQARLETTTQLTEVLRRAGVRTPRRLSQAFQALRLAVNHELESLRGGLEAAARVLPPGGRLTAISFESLMDRMVKQTFRPPRTERPLPGVPDPDPVWKVLTPRAIRPRPEETERNPRARSARLRAAERTAHA